MTARNYVHLLAAGWLAIASSAPGFCAESGDVTVVSTSSSQPAPAQQTAQTDGTPVVHKSLHRKKHKQAVAASSTAPAPGSATTANASPVVVTSHQQKAPPSSSTHAASGVTVTVGAPAAPLPPATLPASIAPTNVAVVRGISVTAPAPTVIARPATDFTLNAGPQVETGLPVAHYPGMGTPIKGVSTYIPVPAQVIVPAGNPVMGTTTHQSYFASTLPAAILPLTSKTATSFIPPSRTTTTLSSNFVFSNFSHKRKLFYPWKSGIITTTFWIGEGGSSISPTDNVASAWDPNWRTTNRGTDTPDDRNGFAPANHAATVNPFYVALPFNDLAFPDKAREWVPGSWHRPMQDGKQVSACKDRWVQIKNENGHSCFAQWEDVGPLRYDHAEYVFGAERPDTYTRAGLDVSPAVAQYLGIDGGKRAITSWKFVDDEDVPPGAWLRYDEQAVIYTALHQLKTGFPTSDLPIQKASEPIDDADSINANKKKVGASRG